MLDGLVFLVDSFCFSECKDCTLHSSCASQRKSRWSKLTSIL